MRALPLVFALVLGCAALLPPPRVEGWNGNTKAGIVTVPTLFLYGRPSPPTPEQVAAARELMRWRCNGGDFSTHQEGHDGNLYFWVFSCDLESP